MPAPQFYRLQKLLCGILFCLIVLGAGVRIASAGLACPDWPLCFGQAVPDFNFQIFMEWIHRVVAGTSGILALIVSVSIWRNRILRSRLGFVAFLSILLFGLQAFLGRQTVLQFLRSDTVTAHLIGGYSLFAINLIMLFKWRARPAGFPLTIRLGFQLLLLLAFFQAVLGGLVSSHYAGMACEGFPKCQGQWWPELVGSVAYHFVHRLGASALFIAGSLLTLLVYKKTPNTQMRRAALFGLQLVLLQWIWGVSMIFSSIHPALSLAHSATSLGIFTTYLIGVMRSHAQ